MQSKFVLAMSFGAALVSCTQSDESSLSDTDAHAQRVYESYAEASRGRVQFDVRTVEAGRVAEVMHRSVNELLGVPEHRLVMEELGTELTDVSMIARDRATDEWSSPVMLSGFETYGRDTSAATYRVLAVQATVDGVATEHRALQVCFVDEADCSVMDPVVDRLESFAEDRARLLAEGWKIESREVSGGEVSTLARCTLASNFNNVGRSLTWSSRTITYKNLYGITVVTHRLGGQQTGISCYVSGTACRAATFGYSNASSCDANLGFNCDCSNTGMQSGTGTSAARAWSETKCEHKNVLQGSANVSWTRGGTGANFSISWSTSGGTVNSNGGTLYDTCAWH
jgi:hypothetical protein